MATFEPEAADSWFSWNFFDAVLQRKEYFSSYVFEDLAADLLDQGPGFVGRLPGCPEEASRMEGESPGRPAVDL